MLLGIDTATRWLSLALAEAQSGDILAERTWLTQNMHSVELAPAVAAMLQQAGASPAGLTGLAVAGGPGSYTGLRVGMSFAKGLAMTRQPALPLISLPTLDVIAAAQPPAAPRLLAVIQAGRARIIHGEYVHQAGRWSAVGAPQGSTWAELAAQLEQADRPIQIAGEIDAAARAALGSIEGCLLLPGAFQVRRAAFLIHLAAEHLAQAHPASAARAVPWYLT